MIYKTLVSDDELVIAKWGYKWIRYAFKYIIEGGPAHQLAERLLHEFEIVNDEPDDYVEIYKKVVTKRTPREDENGQVTFSENIHEKENRRLGKGMRSKFSMSVGKKAYNKFGQRPMSEANVIVTRKWIQKYLDEDFKDLRTCDKNLAIDRALFLSFVPTKDFNRYKLVMATAEMETRMTGLSPWGQIFRLRRDLP